MALEFYFTYAGVTTTRDLTKREKRENQRDTMHAAISFFFFICCKCSSGYVAYISCCNDL